MVVFMNGIPSLNPHNSQTKKLKEAVSSKGKEQELEKQEKRYPQKSFADIRIIIIIPDNKVVTEQKKAGVKKIY